MSGVVNYSTKVAVATTVAEMQERLVSAGASHIGTSYDDGVAVALTFMLRTAHGERHFTVPVNIEKMQRLIRAQWDAGRIKSGGMSKAERLGREHAARVAWRVMKDWLAATLAIVEADLLPLDEVMLPYLMVDPNRTLAQAYRERESALELTTGHTS